MKTAKNQRKATKNEQRPHNKHGRVVVDSFEWVKASQKNYQGKSIKSPQIVQIYP